MKNETAELRRENDRQEKLLTHENQRWMNRITSYLHKQNAEEFEVEYVRQDILHMLLEGQARGEPAETIIGTDYKAFSREVLKVLPKMTEAQKEKKQIGNFFLLFPFIGMLNSIVNVLFLIGRGQNWECERALAACMPLAGYTLVSVVVCWFGRKTLDFHVTWLCGKKRYIAAGLAGILAAAELVYYFH